MLNGALMRYEQCNQAAVEVGEPFCSTGFDAMSRTKTSSAQWAVVWDAATETHRYANVIDSVVNGPDIELVGVNHPGEVDIEVDGSE